MEVEKEFDFTLNSKCLSINLSPQKIILFTVIQRCKNHSEVKYFIIGLQ